MSTVAINKLEQLIEQNEKMLKYAQAGEWDKVTENEVIRQQLIKTFYSASSDVRDAAVIADATRELLRVNEKLKQLAIDARDKVKTDFNEANIGKIAINAYTRNMR